MSRLSQVKENRTVKPVRIMIMGTPGVGKSSLIASAPNPIFITPEGGIDEIPGAKEMPGVKTWDDIRESVKELLVGNHNFQTLGIDSADWLEKLCHAHIIGKTGKTIITMNGGYGAGYRGSEQMHRELIADLSELREKRGMNIVVTAHPQVKAVKDPDAVQDYDSHQIKCHEFVASLWREWVDALLFARFETHVKRDEDATKGRAFGTGKRIVLTEERPSYQAKNRFNLPHEMEFTRDFWNVLMEAAGRGAMPDIDVLRADIAELFQKIEDEPTKFAVEKCVKEAYDNQRELHVILKRLREITKG